MELRQLRYFVTIAEQRSFTAASKLLYVAQPSLSRQLAKLEAELGAQLLERSVRPVELTSAGRSFLASAQEVLAAAERAKLAARTAQVEAATRLPGAAAARAG